MQRMRKIIHIAAISSLLMTLVAVAFPATVGAANLEITPGSHDFGSVEIGTTSADQEFVVRNIDSPLVTINNVTVSDGGQWFEVSANGCLGAVLQATEQCTFSVVFSPDLASDF